MVEEEQRYLAGFARAVLLNLHVSAARHDVEAVLNDAYIHAATRLRDDGELRVENMHAWFRGVIFNTCLERRRRGFRYSSLFVQSLEDEIGVLNQIDQTTVSVDLTIAADEVLKNFSEQDQEIVKLAAAGYTSDEIAALLGDMTAVAVRKRKSRALAALKKSLGG